MLIPSQKDILKADIIANPDTNQLYVDGNLQGLADLYNAPAVPTYIVWKTSVSQQEIMLDTFDWTRVDNLSVGTARVWEWMFEAGQGFINPSNTNIRAGIDATWKGTAADLAVRAAVYVHCKRSANRIEKLFASGTGSDAVPATMTFEGLLSYTELIGL